MKLSTLIKYNNNNNNNIVICKAHKVSSNAESEAPAIARWTALVAAISPSRISSSYLLLGV